MPTEAELEANWGTERADTSWRMRCSDQSCSPRHTRDALCCHPCPRSVRVEGRAKCDCRSRPKCNTLWLPRRAAPRRAVPCRAVPCHAIRSHVYSSHLLDLAAVSVPRQARVTLSRCTDSSVAAVLRVSCAMIPIRMSTRFSFRTKSLPPSLATAKPHCMTADRTRCARRSSPGWDAARPRSPRCALEATGRAPSPNIG